MRRCALLVLAVVMLLLTIPCVGAPTLAATTAPETSAASFALLDADSGTLLAGKDMDTRLPMASTTKIMTALVVLETLPLDTVVEIPPEAVGIEGSSIYLYRGEQITVHTLLYALMLSSANDAAVALALACDGSIEAFAARMNQKAAELELLNTHFCNPNGLHDREHYTTARDLARLTAAALQNPVFAEIVATRRHTAAQQGTGATRLFVNHNRLLRTLDGAIGVKTGFTRAAGRCLVSAARRDGLTLIAVTLNDPNDWHDHTALHEWGFSAFVRYTPSPEPLRVPVVGGVASEVTLLPTGSLSLLLPADHADITCTYEAPRFLFAGVKKGEQRGRIVYRLDGEIIGELALQTAGDVPAQKKKGFFARLFDLF